jgi:hypothetical protein
MDSGEGQLTGGGRTTTGVIVFEALMVALLVSSWFFVVYRKRRIASIQADKLFRRLESPKQLPADQSPQHSP